MRTPANAGPSRTGKFDVPFPQSGKEMTVRVCTIVDQAGDLSIGAVSGNLDDALRRRHHRNALHRGRLDEIRLTGPREATAVIAAGWNGDLDPASSEAWKGVQGRGGAPGERGTWLTKCRGHALSEPRCRIAG